MTSGTTFGVSCIHCEVTVLITPQIRAADQERLVKHLVTVHPTVPFYTSPLTRVLDHFVVRPDPGGISEPR